jgi:outer membrane assembly lipoprotein YfiO
MRTGPRVAAFLVTGLVLAAALASPGAAKDKSKKKALLPPEEAYAEAMHKMEKKKYFSARTMLQELLPRIPPEDRDLLPRVQLSLADAFYKDGGLANYGEALNAYRNFLTYFPQSDQASYAQLMVGKSLFEQVSAPDRDQATTVKAIEELRKVETAWPNSPHATEAREVMEECNNRLAEKERLVGAFYQKRKQWLAALDRYKVVTETYPRYDNMSRLLLDLGRCQLAINKRDDAQETFSRLAALDGSEKLVKQADLAMRQYDKRREKEGEQFYGGLGQDEKKKGSKP